MDKNQLPVNKAEDEANAELMQKVSARSGVSETISDDAEISEEKRQMIATVERLVRETLAIFGMDYDALIRMDGKSLYARVVSRRPEVLEAVMADANPVLAALKIAVGFQPYAEFVEKYGDEPEAIKKAIREEVLAEMKQARSAQESGVVQTPTNPSFSGQKSPQNSVKKSQKATGTLADIFGK